MKKKDFITLMISTVGRIVFALGMCMALLPEWGAMLSIGRTYIRDHWHMCVFPGLTIFLNVMALNVFGDGLRDALDPRMKS